MLCVAIVFSLLALASQSMTEPCDCLQGKKCKGVITEYGISEGSPEKMKEITACFWMSSEAVAKGKEPSMLSYATSSLNNEFLLYLKAGGLLVVVIKNKGFYTNVTLADGTLHHVCVIWTSSGILRVFKDGQRVWQMLNVLRGQEISSGGDWVFAQDQDKVGGGFQTKDAFIGVLTQVNVWNKELCSSEIKQLAVHCGSFNPSGNYKSYSDFDIYGDPGCVPLPSCCPK